jgi:uncharacterized lipoprotein NlpE involved in copper resistance
MKFFFQLSILALLVFTACKSENNPESSNDGVAVNDSSSEEISHTAIKARDHIGLYQGILPCADCEGIETSLYLMANNAYLLTKVYKGMADDKAYKEIGDFEWNADGTTVTLSNIEDAPNQFIVEDTRAIQLDMEGKKIEGELAELYVLVKQ